MPTRDREAPEHFLQQAPQAQKGRGAVSNLQGRYELQAREPFDDGWGEDDDAASGAKTQVLVEEAKSILSRNASPDVPFGVSLNPYRGCEHVMRQKKCSTFCSLCHFFG